MWEVFNGKASLHTANIEYVAAAATATTVAGVLLFYYLNQFLMLFKWEDFSSLCGMDVCLLSESHSITTILSERINTNAAKLIICYCTRAIRYLFYYIWDIVCNLNMADNKSAHRGSDREKDAVWVLCAYIFCDPDVMGDVLNFGITELAYVCWNMHDNIRSNCCLRYLSRNLIHLLCVCVSVCTHNIVCVSVHV